MSRIIYGGLLAAVVVPTSTLAVHAEPSLADIAEQIAALRIENTQVKAENRRMQAASPTCGENRPRKGEGPAGG